MKKIIARISNRFGNQMFTYAAAFSIAKKLNRLLELDVISGIESLGKKNKYKNFTPKYELDIFNISSQITLKANIFHNFYKKMYRKILLFEDKFNSKKNFIIEPMGNNKETRFNDNYDNSILKDNVFLEGYFESEKYFKDYRSDIINEFTFKSKIPCKKKFIDQINNTNSVSICIRANRFSENAWDDSNQLKLNKSLLFEKEQFQYIIRSVNFLKSKIENPHFYLFSDDSDKISHLFNDIKNVILINEYEKNKIHEDFYLMSRCKHHIVAPTTFHFWPAWLSEYKYKICIRPKNLNVSNNLDYWPEQWISI